MTKQDKTKTLYCSLNSNMKHCSAGSNSYGNWLQRSGYWFQSFSTCYLEDDFLEQWKPHWQSLNQCL